MPVYSGEKPEYLDKAIESMVKQTIKPEQFVIFANGEKPTHIPKRNPFNNGTIMFKRDT